MGSYVINRIGAVEGDGLRAHFMRDHIGDRTACGKRVVSSWNCTKDSGIANVDCGHCWEVKWGDE
jgi:hypothetical protein